ncbi:MAG TPA: sigma-54 dependent transcriptional regulator [Kofleriaceae bacterium]
MLGVGHSLLRFEPVDDESEAPLSQDESWDRALGRSPAMRRIFELLPRIAASNSTVLLEGETGTGKGLIAEALHRNSPRADGPLVVVDCGSIPPTLIESELFGHEKGAFTGANTARAGAFEAAQDGTVFLDEIGELALDMQPKLLRALEERTVKRLGSVHAVPLQVRVIAATNRDLREEINKGTFRSDLYYRLNTVKIRIPPLRERPEDIPMLVSHFYGQFVGNETAEPSPALLSSLCRQSWPGNVRELRSAVERAVLLGDLELWNEINAPGAQPSSGAEPRDVFDPALSFRAAKDRAVARWEKWFVDELTRRHTGNLSRAARAARMDRNHLRELLQKHGVGAKDD